MKLIPIWAQAAIVGVIVVIIFGAGWKVADWRASGKVATAEAERDAAVLERDEKQAFAKGCREDLRLINLELTAKETERLILQAKYDEATSQPPEVVIRYRDRWHDAPATIVSADCPEAVGQLIEFLHALPGREVDHGG